MAKYEIDNLFVGDLVVQPHLQKEGVGVVTSVKPFLQIAGILDQSAGDTKIRLGLPGTVREPVEVIGSICVEQVIDSLSAPYAKKGLDVTDISEMIIAAAALGPIRHPVPLRPAA